MREIADKFRVLVENFSDRFGFGMRAKLIILFVITKVVPIVILALIAWRQAWIFGDQLGRNTDELRDKANNALVAMGNIAVADSVSALNNIATEDIERMTTDTAQSIAYFLYQRDDDIRVIAAMQPDEDIYRAFIQNKKGRLVVESEWELAADGESWVNVRTPQYAATMLPANNENEVAFRYRPPDNFEYESRYLYLEITFVDTEGNEKIKITTSPQMESTLKNVSDRWNTYINAEDYFAELKELKPGEIYVSDVIGAYVRSRFIGMYTPTNVEAAGLEFKPEEEAYAGGENPLGKRFKGIVRWATPVVEDGEIIGYVTLALDHDHIMEFTSRITPTLDRYTEVSSAYEGNYAYIWDYKCRSIAHPRHHSIVGYDPQTGEPQIPWLEQSIFDSWQRSGRTYSDYIKNQPLFHEQSREKTLSVELAEAGLVALDGRYLNNAPQCIGWMYLTLGGGSGSFNILWDGQHRLTTAAAIPYYTGQYNESRRGFGFVTIGADFDYFQRPAHEMEALLKEQIDEANELLTANAEATKKSITENMIDTTTQLVIASVAMVLLVVLIAIWMASAFTQSITNLINGISRFRSGERHFRFHSKMRDELGTLADSFDEMADRLVESVNNPLVIIDMEESVKYLNDHALRLQKQYTIDDIVGLQYSEVSVYPINSRYCPVAALKEGRESEILYLPNEGRYLKGKATFLHDKDGKKTGYIIVTEDVTNMALEQERLREIQTELEKAINDANRANEYKGEFLARMSHEIKTPMNVIIGMTNIVKRKLTEAGEQEGEIISGLGQIEDSSQHLLGMVNEILDLSKIDSGKINLSIEKVDICKLADTVASVIRPRCMEKNIEFVLTLDVPEDMFAETDPLRLRQVLINLLSNAVKFTNELGCIEFGIIYNQSDDGFAHFDFYVQDNGIGIPKEAFESIFMPFEQRNTGMARLYAGAGLGLAISRSIVRMMGGDISVSSRVGEGSRFSFNLIMKESAQGKENEEVEVEAKDMFAGKRALLVDDVAINRMIAIGLMEYTGMDIDEAEDGEEALRLFEASSEGTYDIIYMDLQMPKMDGYEASARIRALDRDDAKLVPIVALTANAFKDDVENALQHGMNAHLAKPLDIQKLIVTTFKFMGAAVGK